MCRHGLYREKPKVTKLIFIKGVTRRKIMGLAASQSRLLTLTARLSDLELQAQSISNAKIQLANQAEQASQAYSDALDKESFKVYSGDTSTYIDASARNLTTYQAVSSTDKQRFIKDSSNKVLVTSTVGNAYTVAGGDVEKFLNYLGYTTDKGVTASTPKTITGDDPATTTVETSFSKNVVYDSGAVQYYTNVFNEIQSSGGYNTPGDNNMGDKDWLSTEISNGNVFLYEYDPTAGTAGTGDFTNVSWDSGDPSLQEVTDNTQTAQAEAVYDTTTAQIQAKDKRFDLSLADIDTEHTAIQTELDSVKKVIDKNIERSFKIFDA